MTIKLTREEAIQDLEAIKSFEKIARGRLALDMAIEALKGEDHDGCDGCRYEANDEYMTPCNKCKQNYKDEYKPKPKHDRDWIVGCIKHDGFIKTDRGDKANQIILEALKADRPRGEWTLLTEERPVDNYEIITTVYWPGYGDSTIAVGHIDRFDNWHLYSPTEGELIKGFEVIAWRTLPEPYCGADMRGDTE